VPPVAPDRQESMVEFMYITHIVDFLNRAYSSVGGLLTGAFCSLGRGRVSHHQAFKVHFHRKDACYQACCLFGKAYY